MSFKGGLVAILLILAAFGVGYGLGYWKLQTAEKEWAAEKGAMQEKIKSMEKELTAARAREKLYEMPEMISGAGKHLAEKNFGLAVKALEGIKETFLAALNSLGGEMKSRFEFFIPALEEAKKEVETMGANAARKVEEVKELFEKALRPAKKE